LRYVLAKLAQHIDEQAWGSVAPHTDLEKYINSKIEMEHILPVTPDAAVLASFDKAQEVAEYIPRLGNLTLLEKSINGSIQNGVFGAKKVAYLQSNFLLTKAIAAKPVVGKDTAVDRAVRLLEPFPQWTSESIARRQGFLQRLAHDVWEMPLPAMTGAATATFAPTGTLTLKGPTA
jgi:Protein of unknown function (DUF1524)